MKRLFRLLALSLVLPVSAIAQGQAGIRISGSDTLEPLLEAAVAQYKKGHADAALVMEAKGTSTGFSQLCENRTDLAMASRAINGKELAACRSKNVAFIEMPVAWDAVVLVANRNDGWLRDINLAELRLIWGPESNGKKLAWNQIRAAYPATPVALFGLDQKSDAFDFFSTVISGSPKVMRSDFQDATEHAAVIDRVSKTPGAIGFVSMAAYAENASKVAALAVDEGGGPVIPSSQSVISGQYGKLARLTFLYVNKAAYDGRPQVRDFANFVIEGAGRFASYARFVPLTNANYQEQATRLKRGDAGSLFSK